MRSNANKSAALAFDALADNYAAGRPDVDPDFVRAVVDRVGGASPGAPVLEIGAGTGQLTAGLLAAGYRVTALEPAPELRRRLRARFASAEAAGRLSVSADRFTEGARLERAGYDQLWAADAFHWIEPREGYPLAAEVLRPGGRLCLLWTFPVLADAATQDRLNDVYRRLAPDLVRDPHDHLGEIEPALAGGRDELHASDRFADCDHWIEERVTRRPAEAYIALQFSYSNIAALSQAERVELHRQIRGALDGRDAVDLRTYLYVLTARVA